MENLEFKVTDPIPNYPGEDKGLKGVQIKAILNGKEVGYIKSSFIPKSTWNKMYPTPVHWKGISGGWCGKSKESFREGDWKEGVRNCYPVKRKYKRRRLDRDVENLSDKELKEEFEGLCERYQESYEKFEVSLKGNPFVDYISVEEKYRRNGIALKLYEKMGRYLAKEYNLTLRASSLQQESARLVWEKMKEEESFPTGEMELYDKTVPYLDYR